MYNVLSITLPFFAIIFLGTFFHYKKVFNNDSSRILTKFALYVTLPPFMFVNILKSSDDIIFEWNFIIFFEFTTIFLLTTTFLISLYFFNNNKKDSSLFALNSTYPNYGYMGIPLCVLAFGENAIVPISLILLIDTIILLSFTIFFIEFNQKKSFILELFNLIKNIIKNPILLAALIGFLFLILKIEFPDFIFSFLEILAFAATPTALFAIGINLYNKVEYNSFANIFIISIFKLIIHPLIVFSIFYFIPNQISPLWVNVAILCSCLPVAGNVFAMSIYYNSFINYTSGSVLITTVLSTISVPIILFFLLY